MTQIVTIPDKANFDGAKFKAAHGLEFSDFIIRGDKLHFPEGITLVWADYAVGSFLSHDVASPPLVVANDGIATTAVVITDSRGAASSGKVVNLRLPSNAGTFWVDTNKVTLDASGQGTFTFGKCPADCCTPDDGVTVQFAFAVEADPAPLQLVVKFE